MSMDTLLYQSSSLMSEFRVSKILMKEVVVRVVFHMAVKRQTLLLKKTQGPGNTTGKPNGKVFDYLVIGSNG